MAGLVEYVILIAVLCLAWCLLGAGVHLVVGDRPAWLRRLAGSRTRHPAPEPVPTTPIVMHELELARLADLVCATYDSTQPARAFRVNVAAGAYDMELIEACRTLGLPGPGSHPPLTAQDRFETEAKLFAAGMHW